MPAAIPAALIVGELASRPGRGLIIGSSGVALVGYGIIGAGIYGLNYAAQALQGSEKRADQQITVRQSVAPRRRVLVRPRLGASFSRWRP